MNLITDLSPELQCGVAAGLAFLLLAISFWAVRSGRGCTESPETQWPTDLPPPEREARRPVRRRVRAGAPVVPGPDGPATLSPLPQPQIAAITRMAHACATNDFRNVGRPSANPYSRNTRAHTIYAIEYAAKWEELEQQYGRLA